MAFDMALVRLVVNKCTLAGVVPVLGLGVEAGESAITHTPPRGDRGRAAGINQTRTDVHTNIEGGDDPTFWEGYDGAARSLDRALQLGDMARPGPPDWPAAQRKIQAERGNWDGTAAWFRDFWIAGQNCTPMSLARAQEALDMGRAAWAAYLSEEQPMLTRRRVPTPPFIIMLAHPNNYTKGRPAGIKREGFCVHTSGGGRFAQAVARFFQLAIQRHPDGSTTNVATRWVVGEDERQPGTYVIIQCVPDGDTHHAQALGKQPTARVVLDNGDLDPNTYLDAAELSDNGIPGNHAREQLKLLAWLIAWRFDSVFFVEGATDVEVSRKNIVGHYEVSDFRAQCPNLDPVEWQFVVDEVANWLYEETAPGELPEDVRLAAAKQRIADLENALTLDAEAWEEEQGEAETLGGILAMSREQYKIRAQHARAVVLGQPTI